MISSALLSLALLFPPLQQADPPPMLGHGVVGALDSELSGEEARRNLEVVARHHRMRASRQFHAVAAFLVNKAVQYGLSDAEIIELPADGQTFYGTQKARPAWDADFAELWEMVEHDGQWIRSVRLANWESMPVTLAQDSDSAEVTADLIDVGAGTSPSDYEGKDVRGKIVLTSSQPGPVAVLAVDQYGAAGIVSYVQNQRTAWYGEDENLVRWGHLDSFSPRRTFGFQISLKQARAFQRRLAAGEIVRLYAKVEAARRPGFYEVVTATIPGADPVLREEEIALSCHLDHQRPGANDNASGCVAIMEVARTLQKLIDEGRIERPARTIRFIWPPEIEGTMALLHGRPELAERIKAVVHMDMVGGGPVTKATFHVTRGPGSLPSFVYDVGQAWGTWLNRQTQALADGGSPPFPVVAPEGGKEPLHAELADFDMGSDHQVYTEGSFRIPSIYLNDWPDRYIHTNFDLPANIDPTKLKRAAFIGAASAYFLASPDDATDGAAWAAARAGILRRTSQMFERRALLEDPDAENHTYFFLERERAALETIAEFTAVSSEVEQRAESFMEGIERLTGSGSALGSQGGTVYSRNPEVRGPMSTFGYNYLADHLGAERASSLGLGRFSGIWGSGGEYSFEVLNLVNGGRTVGEIRDALSAIYGPVPVELVAEYLSALQEIGIVSSR